MNIRTLVAVWLVGWGRSVDASRLVHHIGRFRNVRFRRLFNHQALACNARATRT
jgi:hypothetical protein